MLNNDTIRKIKKNAFGKRYEDCCMSQIKLPSSINKQIKGWIDNPKNMLIISGGSGCGKTFLCSSILDYFLNKQMEVNKDREPFTRGYIEREFFREVRTNSGSEYSQRLSAILDYHMIIFDDFGSSGATEWRKEILFNLINARYESMLPTIITTNLSYHDIKTCYGDRVTDRMFNRENVEVNMSKLDSKRT